MSPRDHAPVRPSSPPPTVPFATTVAVRAGIATETQHGAVVPPIHLSSNYSFRGYGDKRPYDYTRTGNPTRDLLGEALAELEGGAGAVVTSSGMSAVALALHLIEPGGLLVAPHDCYGGTHRLMSALAERGGFRLRFVDQTDDDALDAAFAEGPSMVWVETPSNPLLRITDLAGIAARAREAGALFVADNTFLSPVLQRPIEWGADLVLHSTTKYLNGHSDVVGGAVVARDEAVHAELAEWANCLGLTGAPFDAYLTLRGLRTLDARMRVHLANADAVVSCLADHPAVERVYHPSLTDHPGHEVAARQQSGFGAMVSFELRSEAAVRAFVAELGTFTLAESLGGVESLVAHPATMTHASMDADARATAGISDRLLRLSVGIEAAVDLVADLERALGAARETDDLGAGSEADAATATPTEVEVAAGV
ncbi:cystathionine gamma-synthase [Gaopeijia maritima]|uniref:Cystathionine gamma-synthase n=1 Tax=Gaopeijia maritima TaxID=3119007 RepID=A0ABU9E694_9BACT